MGLHRCTEQECPYLGQTSGRGCGCHKTDEQVLQGRVERLEKALRKIVDGYYPAADVARSALEETA